MFDITIFGFDIDVILTKKYRDNKIDIAIFISKLVGKI